MQRGIFITVFLLNATALAVSEAELSATRTQVAAARSALIAYAREVDERCRSAEEEECRNLRRELVERHREFDRQQESYRTLENRYAAERRDEAASRTATDAAARYNAASFREAGTAPRSLVDNRGNEFQYAGNQNGTPFYRDANGNTLYGFHDGQGNWRVAASQGTAPTSLQYDSSQIVDLRTGGAVSSNSYRPGQSVTTNANAATANELAWTAIQGVTGLRPISTVNLPVEVARANGSDLGSLESPHYLSETSLGKWERPGYPTEYFVRNFPQNLPPGVYSIPMSTIRIQVPGPGRAPELIGTDNRVLAEHAPITVRWR